MTTKTSLMQKAQRFFTSYWGAALALAVGWQAFMTLVGVVADVTFGAGENRALAHMAWWDGGWYLSILNGSYTNPASPSPAFYPLFPLTVHLLQLVTLHTIGVLALGLIVNTLSLWLALVALLKIAEFFVSKTYNWWVATLFLASPAAIFLHLFYSEAIFCAVAFWAYLFALRRKWALMAILLAVLTSARLPSVLFIGLCGLEFMRAYRWRLKEILNPNVLWFLLAPLGFIAYGLYLKIVRGDFLAMLHSYSLTQDWTYHVFNPNIAYTILKEVYKIVLVAVGSEPLAFHVIISSVLPVLALAILFVASLYALFVVKGRAVPLGTFGIASMVLFTLNNNTVSVHRYVLPCIVIYLIVVAAIQKYTAMRPVLYGAVYVSILTQMYLICLMVSGRFAG